MRTIKWTLGGVATAGSLIIALLSLARDATDYTVGVPPTEQTAVATTVAGTPTMNSAAPLHTEVIYMRPWNFGELNPSLIVTERHSARCITPSINSDDPTSLRCFSDDSGVYDPCWQDAADAAVCPGSPWEPDVTLLEPAKVDSREINEAPTPTGPSGTPWALELTNGRKCLFTSGVTGEVAGMRLNFLCDNDETVWAVGELDRTDRVWRILFSAPGSSAASFVDVVKVWV